MPTTPAPRVDPRSVDTAGVSILTATPTPGMRTLYSTTTFAAATPVWVHPLWAADTFLMASARRWTAATPSTTAPGAYTAYTEDTEPSWVTLGSAGLRSDPVAIPRRTAVDAATLVGGASRPPGYVYLLHDVTMGDSHQGLLQHFIANPHTGIALAGEEILPTVTLADDNPVLFHRGVQYQTPYLVVYGTDTDGVLYRIRKPWARVGVNKQVRVSTQSHGGVVGTQMGWEYWTGLGYSYDPTELGPLPWSTAGPMSFAFAANQTLATTVTHAAGAYHGQVWSSRQGRPFTALGDPIALGLNAQYLGGGVQLMGQLGGNPAAPEMLGALAGVPYVTWRKTTVSGADTLATTWSLLGVS